MLTQCASFASQVLGVMSSGGLRSCESLDLRENKITTKGVTQLALRAAKSAATGLILPDKLKIEIAGNSTKEKNAQLAVNGSIAVGGRIARNAQESGKIDASNRNLDDAMLCILLDIISELAEVTEVDLRGNARLSETAPGKMLLHCLKNGGALALSG